MSDLMGPYKGWVPQEEYDAALARLAAVVGSLHVAIEDAMVLREEAAPNDGLAAGLVETLTAVHAELRAALGADHAD